MYESYLLKLEEAGKFRNLRPRSIQAYKNYVSYFLRFTGKHPDSLTCQDVRDFLLSKKDQGLKASTLNLYNSSIRFFFRYVLRIPWDDILIPRMLLERSLPVVLTFDEVERILSFAESLKYKAMFAVMYSSGLRVGETVHLHYKDISRTNMQIHVRDTKNRRDRYTLLSQRCLSLLTEYWFKEGKPRDILFPNQFTGDYLNVGSVEKAMKRAVAAAGITKNATPHSLRHSFATHLMEQGVPRHLIQTLLGHADPRSTEIYLHVSNKSLMNICSPFDQKGGCYE